MWDPGFMAAIVPLLKSLEDFIEKKKNGGDEGGNAKGFITKLLATPTTPGESRLVISENTKNESKSKGKI